MFVWLNGHIVDARRARVSVLDRGLLHGDGIYDTWRTYDGRSFALAAHLRRLTAAARRVELPAPGSGSLWEARTRLLLRRNGLGDGAARLTITRGDAGSGPGPDRRARPTRLLTVRGLPANLAALQTDGVAVTLLPFARDAGPSWGNVKLVGHASAVVGKLVAARRRAYEGFYVTPDGHVPEGTTSNVFMVARGMLCTPPADGSILAGVTRDIVLEVAQRAGIRTRETPITVDRLRRADEIFVTASTIEVVPVVRLDGRRVGGGRPGPITNDLQTGYRAAIARARRRA